MIRTLNLTGFQTGDKLSFSVSQNALMAGPVEVPSWGGPTGGGTILINVERTRMQCAPDSVRFTVDLSKADFDTPGPVGDEIYDARMHDLIYLWDFDDTEAGDWTAPENILPEWKNRNVAKGPFVAHMYTIPRPESLGEGNGYTVSVMVIEPSSGKMATHSVEVFVEDPDTVYPGAQTICINPVGDSDFSEAPDPSNNVLLNLDDFTSAAMTAYQSTTVPKRVLFKKGATFNIDFSMANYTHFLAGSYGSSPNRTTLNPMSITRAFQLNADFAGSPPDLRIVGLRIEGDYDPITTADFDVPANDIRYGVGGTGPVNLMLSDVEFDGVRDPISLIDAAEDRRLHADDCAITNMGWNYPLFMMPGFVLTTLGVLTGCRIAQPSGAHDTDVSRGYSIHSPVRWNSIPRIHMRGCDIYSPDKVHFVLRLNSGANRDGQITNVHSMSLEGGAGAVTFAGDMTNSLSGLGRVVVSNAIFDGILYVGSYSTIRFMEMASTGVTIRNCLCIVPDTPGGYDVSINALQFWVSFGAGGTFDPDVVGAAPLKAYNNTFVSHRSASVNNNQTVLPYKDWSGGLFTDINYDNNVIHMPTYAVQIEDDYAPLTTTRLPWNPRCIGRRPAETMVLDTSYATPPENLAYYRPAAGSLALGAALQGNVSYMDPTLKMRPEPPSVGAWEME